MGGRRADHQALDRQQHIYYRVVDSAREAAEFSRADGEALTFDLDDQGAAQHDEALIALQMRVRSWVAPACLAIVIPNLEPIGLETDLIGWCMAGEQRAIAGKLMVMEQGQARSNWSRNIAMSVTGNLQA